MYMNYEDNYMKNSLITKQIFLIAVLMLLVTVMGVLIVQAHYAFYTDSVTASNVMSADSIAWFNTQYDCMDEEV